ncbi:MAG: hypothetical protein ABI601_03090 [bacterium]
MTHAGQLALLRRLSSSPEASEDFIFADVRTDRVAEQQPDPVAPDARWRPSGIWAASDPDASDADQSC